MIRTELLQESRHCAEHQCPEPSKGDSTRFATPGTACTGNTLLSKLKQMLRIGEKCLSSRSEIDAPSRPNEKLRTNGLFDVFDVSCQWWLRYVQPTSCAAQAQIFSHCNEIVKLPKV